MTPSDANELLRHHTRRLASEVGEVGGTARFGHVAVGPCLESGGGITEELLSVLTAHHQALDTLESVVGRVNRRAVRPGGPVAEALNGAYEASDVAHDAVRRALASLRDAARLQRDALRVAHLAMMIAAEAPSPRRGTVTRPGT